MRATAWHSMSLICPFNLTRLLHSCQPGSPPTNRGAAAGRCGCSTRWPAHLRLEALSCHWSPVESIAMLRATPFENVADSARSSASFGLRESTSMLLPSPQHLASADPKRRVLVVSVVPKRTYTSPIRPQSLVGLVGFVVAMRSVRHSLHNSTQLALWFIFMCMCVADAYASGLRLRTSMAYLLIPSRLMWVWVLFNWTMAPKGYSWRFYRSSSTD